MEILDNGRVWLIRYLNMDKPLTLTSECRLVLMCAHTDFINNYSNSTFLKQHIACNMVLPTHQDSNSDAINTIQSYIDSAILHVGEPGSGMRNMGTLGKILHHKKLFNAIFHVFILDHFQNYNNAKVGGLSIHTIYSWFPHHIGVSDSCHYIDPQKSDILSFTLAHGAPVDTVCHDP